MAHLKHAPTVVFHRQLRGEPVLCHAAARLHALRDRIRRATNNCEWANLWQEMVAASARQHEWYSGRDSRSNVAASSTEQECCRRRAVRSAQKAQNGRAASALVQAQTLSPSDPAVLAKIQSLHTFPLLPVM